MIAREIRRIMNGAVAVRTPLHFSDFAVILRRIGEYEGVLRTVFREFQIPVEIHERERLRNAPVARTLTDFFNIMLEDWKREDLFNFLKSSYVEKDYAEVCTLELQGFRRGIVSGRERWLKEIGHPLFERINLFQEKFVREQTVEGWIRLTEEVIRSFQLSQLPMLYEEKARRDFASLKRLRSILEEIRQTHAAAPLPSFELFAKELLGLIEVDLFFLHDRDKNRVQVYDVSLARQKEYKVVFLAGLLEKYFPVEIREDPILSDEERKKAGLPERLPRQALERYFFYVGLTRAREKVVLSYPRFDLEGREALPSFYVDEVSRLFSEPAPKRSYPVSQPLPLLEDAVSEKEVERNLILQFYEKKSKAPRKKRVLAYGLYNRFIQKDSFKQLLGRILFTPEARIQNEEIRAKFLPVSGIFKPTGLEIYGRCPYRYFLSQVLNLEEEEEGIDPRTVGIVLHAVLEDYWTERAEKGRKDLEEIDKAREYVKERLHVHLQEEPLEGEKAYRIDLKKAQMEAWLFRMVEKEIEEGSAGLPLYPRYFEFEFGIRPKEVGHLVLYDAYREDLKLRGKIDRIDVDPSGKFGLVIDYKTGSDFKLQGLESGTALQLPLYLLAIQKLLKLKPLGAQIYQISKAKKSGFFSKEALEELQAEGVSKNKFGAPDFQKILERGAKFSHLYAEGIQRAGIAVRPRECDTHCPFPAVCRIEKWRLPFIYQEIREEDKKSGIV